MFHVELQPALPSHLISVLSSGAAELGIDLPNSLRSAFQIYLRELQAWNQKTNLTAITGEEEIVIKHFLDSLALTLALEPPVTGRLLDVGSGAGFPGLPLKLLHPQLDVTLLEPSQKKTAFLRHLIGKLNLEGVTVLARRVEDVKKGSAPSQAFRWIVTRAVKAGDLLPAFRTLLEEGGRIILCRTERMRAGTPLDGLQIKQEIAYTLPRGYGNRVLTVLTSP